MSDQKRLIQNFSAMGFLQLLNYGLPFVTLPYLVRVLDIEGYGIYVFSQSFIMFFIILTDFGFELSATREVSLYRKDNAKLSNIVSSVLIIKFLLALSSFVVFIAIIFFVESLREYWLFHLLSFMMVFGNILLSFHFFQGVEKMKFIAFLNAGVKIFFTLSIFIMVKDRGDLFLVPAINSMGYIFAGLISICLMRKMGISIYLPSKIDITNRFKDSLQFFWSRMSVSLYTTSNIFIIGLLLGPSSAGIYGAAEKLFNGFKSLYKPINSVMYPYLTYSKNIGMYKKMLKYIIIINTAISLLVFWKSRLIIELIFGANYEGSTVILQIMSLASISVVPSLMLGYPLFSAFNKTSFVNKSVIYPSILHVMILCLLIPVLSVNKVAFLLLFTETLVFAIRFGGAYKYKLLYRN